MREQRKQTAQETLKIQQQGFYCINNKRVDIFDAQKRSENASYILTPADGRKLVKELTPYKEASDASCEVINASTVQAIKQSSKQLTKANP